MSKGNLASVYNFKRMPFELGRYDAPRIGRDVEWQRLRDLVEATRDSRSPVMGVLLGTYGAGKSFLLWHLAESYSPASKTGILASRPIRLIDPEQRREFIRNLVLRLFRRGLSFDEDLVPLLKTASEAQKEYPSGLKRFVQLLLAAAKGKSQAAARRVLSGGRALRSEALAGGFADAVYIKTNEDAIELLEALQVVLGWAGVKALVLMIDEVEYIDGLLKIQRATVFDSLKHLWDQEVTFFSSGTQAAQLGLVLSATPAFWQGRNQQLRTEGHRPESVVGLTPFFERIQKGNIIEMPAELDADEARQLIVSRMAEVRSGTAGEDIIPFTDDFVAYVYELTQGLPRQIIEICATVMSEAARRKLKKITRAEAANILRDLLISYEPVGERK